jgi:hypothetical protein
MKKNISNKDRIIRLLLAAIVAVLYIVHIIQGTFASILGIGAIILAATAVINFCPIYRILGISSFKNSPDYEA